MRHKFWISLLALAGAALLLGTSAALAQGTITGSPPAGPTNGFTVSLTVPQRVGVSWDRNVVFDLGTGNTGSCGSYPPAPATPTPCYWDDNTAAAMNVQLFANATGAGNLVRASVQGAAGNFGTSNANITNVLYADGNVVTCAAGSNTAACVGTGYLQMSSAGLTTFAQVAAPTAGWVAYPLGKRFIFQVNAGLTTTNAAVNQATFTIALP